MTSLKRKLLHLLPACIGLLTYACTPPEELDGDDLEPSMEWDEIVFHKESLEPMAVANKAAIAPMVSKKHAKKHDGTDSSEVNRRLALNSIQNPFPYAGGILGSKGDSKYFIASTAAIPEYDRLYWVIVKVLSEKYSCFMRSKLDIGAMTRVTCKDRRQILFWKKKHPQFIEFLARQFDRDGFEIKVIRKKIVRISSNRVI